MNLKTGFAFGAGAFNSLDMHQSYQPLVSVITPFFNVESYIAETIASVIAQDYPNWELILIDDGSVDKSTEIAKLYSNKFPGKIIYVQHENHLNKGASPSRNLGLATAKGELVAFLDSDDYWLPQKLRKQVELLEQYPEASVVCEATKYWRTWSEPQKEDNVVQVLEETDRLFFAPELMWQLYPLGTGSGFCTCGLIFKKEIVEAFGGFDETFVGKNQLFEDQVLFAKLYLHANVYISSNCNNFYRQRANSLMHGLYTEGYALEGKYFFLEWLKAYLKQNEITDKRIYRSLQKAYLPYHYPLLYKLSRKLTGAIRKLEQIFLLS